MRPLIRSFAVLLGALLMFGCAAQRPSIDLPEISTWEQRRAVLEQLTDWEFRGRIAVKAGDEGFDAKFRWTQTGDKFSASLSGPLGIGTVQIVGDDRDITLTDKDGVATVLIDAEQELYYRYGWTIPVATLRFWALGIPDPRLPAVIEVDDIGQLTRLEQSGWIVTIASYREGGGQQLPRKMTATNPETRVRMVIDRWLFFER